MDDRRFDDLTRAAARATTRRQVLKAILGVAAGGVLARFDRPARTHARAAAPRIVPGNNAFLRTWERTDRPVAEGRATRTWMWGPEPFTEPVMEPYAESPGGMRQVQYYDKSRMEITDPGADQNSVWYVTNGLLVNELMSGQMQVGHAVFESRSPAQVNVAGDGDDPDGPTYATFAQVRNLSTGGPGAVVSRTIRRDGSVGNDANLAQHNITETEYTPDTNHWIAAPFWSFMTSSGMVYENGQFASAALFLNAYYATGFPVTDAYWARVRVGGTQKDVLTQCFERRCLTYTPDNAPEWRVEMGNVGRHYHEWRTSGGADTVTVDEASPSVEQALVATASQSSEFQLLDAYLKDMGFHPLDNQAFNVGDGGSVSPMLVASYAEVYANPGTADILYPSAANPAEGAVAVVRNADGTITFSAYVGDGGQIEHGQPRSVPGGTVVAGRSAQPRATAACDACYDHCGDIVLRSSLPLEDICLLTSYLTCQKLMDTGRKGFQGCVMGAWGGCMASGGGFGCVSVCEHACKSPCDSCKPHETCCSGYCRDIQTDKYYCGSCGKQCDYSEVCREGSCKDVGSDPNNCGLIGKVCSSNQSCINGICRRDCLPACGTSQTCCEGTCADLSNSFYNCGRCQHVCDDDDDEICIDGQCVEETDCDPPCEQGFHCEGETCVPDATCSPPCTAPLACCGTVCIDLNTNRYSCGSCSHECSGSMPACCSGTCKDLYSDLSCGTCENNSVCESGQRCCSGTCADFDTSEQHCGSCGNACPQGHMCCDGECLDVRTDVLNCGGCGLRCPADYTCCNGQCKDLNFDRNNCGTCGNVCTGAEDTCCNGQCKDIEVDRANCGSCGNVCQGQQVCTNGECKDPSCTAAALALGECCQTDANCDGTEICSNSECVACPGQGCEGEFCCYGAYPYCCPATDNCCPTGFPECPPAGRNGCCPAGNYLCANYEFCCPDDCTCTAEGCDCSDCETHDDCNGTDVCIDSTCVSCSSAGGSPCANDYCCGGDFPVCCGGTVECCPGQFPVCPPSGRNWCCPSGDFLCPNDHCCSQGESCTSTGCEPAEGTSAGAGTLVRGGAGRAFVETREDSVQLTSAVRSARGQRS